MTLVILPWTLLAVASFFGPSDPSAFQFNAYKHVQLREAPRLQEVQLEHLYEVYQRLQNQELITDVAVFERNLDATIKSVLYAFSSDLQNLHNNFIAHVLDLEYYTQNLLRAISRTIKCSRLAGTAQKNRSAGYSWLVRMVRFGRFAYAGFGVPGLGYRLALATKNFALWAAPALTAAAYEHQQNVLLQFACSAPTLDIWQLLSNAGVADFRNSLKAYIDFLSSSAAPAFEAVSSSSATLASVHDHLKLVAHNLRESEALYAQSHVLDLLDAMGRLSDRSASRMERVCDAVGNLTVPSMCLNLDRAYATSNASLIIATSTAEKLEFFTSIFHTHDPRDLSRRLTTVDVEAVRRHLHALVECLVLLRFEDNLWHPGGFGQAS